MASDELEIARELRRQIDADLTIQRWSQDSETKFAPLYLAEAIIRPRLLALCKALFESLSIGEEKSQAFQIGAPKWRILAILLYIRCSRSFLRTFIEGGLGLEDSKLPLDQNLANLLLPAGIRDNFVLRQFIFIPAKLIRGKDLRYVGEEEKCRLPFLGVENVGSGGYGTVWRVKVARGHYFPNDTDAFGPNPTDREFAWKEFEEINNRAFAAELKNIQSIRKASSYSEDLCIALWHGSIQRGTRYSLYFEYANCDLDKYLNETQNIPRTAEEVQSFLQHFQGLLDALVFLHTALKPGAGEDICLVHGDLKPQNILVFNQSSAEEVWKLNDFGESEVMNRYPPKRRWFTCFLFNPAQPFSQEDHTNSGARQIRTGPFLAPETKTTKESNVGNERAKSDVWSMGCILTILLSFLSDGTRSIREFQKRRTGGSGGRNDCFYVARGKKLVLNPEVTAMLGALPADITSASTEAAEEIARSATTLTITQPFQHEKVESVVRGMVSLLQKNLLIVEPSARADSQKMAQRFKEKMDLFQAPHGYISTRRASMSVGKLLGSTGSIENKTVAPRTWGLDIPPESSSCKFSNCGSFLAFFSTQKISLYSTSMLGRYSVLLTNEKEPAKACRMAKILKPPEGSDWSGYDISSTHLIAFTAENTLDIYVHSHIDMGLPSTLYPHRIQASQHPQPHSVCLSPDGEIVILLVYKEPNFYIFSSRLEDILSWPGSLDTSQSPRSTADLRRRSANASTPPTSSHNEDAPTLPWPSYLLNPPRDDRELDIVDIQGMRFSADSKLFTALSHLPKKNKDGTRKMFYSWPRMDDGQFSVAEVKRNERYIEGDFDVDEIWDTAFVPVTEPQPSIFSVTFTRTIAQFGLDETAATIDWASQELEIQLLDIIPVPQEDRWIFIGREKRNKGTVKALFAPLRRNMNFKNNMGKLHFDFVLDLECTNWRAGRDAAATVNGGMHVLVARLDGTGFVRQISRPIAERNG